VNSASDLIMVGASEKSSSFPPELSVVIVNFNAALFLEGCLESVYAQEGARFEVFVVDNASRDDSRRLVKDRFPGVHLIENQVNAGFSRANNQALERAAGEYVYFLNPDTRVLPGTFRQVRNYMKAHPEVGITGTRILNPDGSCQSSVEERYPGGRHGKAALKPLVGDIAWVLGASMAGPRALLREVGGFDERFFLYGEDADICLRVRKAGRMVALIPDAAVVHWGGESERGHHRRAVWGKKVRAEILFFQKHYSRRQCRRICREALLQAYGRLLTTGPLGLFPGKKGAENREKWFKYRAVVRGYPWNP